MSVDVTRTTSSPRAGGRSQAPRATFRPVAQMAIRLVHTKAKHRRFVDVTTIGLRVERDGALYQHFTITASGPQLHTDHKDIVAQPQFWDAAAMVGAIQVRQLLPTLSPLTDPTMPADVPLDFAMVEEVLRSEHVPTIAAGTTLDEWTE